MQKEFLDVSQNARTYERDHCSVPGIKVKNNTSTFPYPVKT
jgi:hypothetical protein